MKPYQCAQAVARSYELPINVVLGRSRKAHVAEARQVLMYVLVRKLQLSVVAAARFVKRDHGAVCHGLKKVTRRLGAREIGFCGRYSDVVRKLDAVRAEFTGEGLA